MLHGNNVDSNGNVYMRTMIFGRGYSFSTWSIVGRLTAYNSISGSIYFPGLLKKRSKLACTFMVLFLLGLLASTGASASRLPKSVKQPRGSEGEIVPDGLMGSFVELDLEFGTGIVGCGGTAIEGGWVLTAAHCVVDDYRQPAYRVSLTLYKSDGTKELIRPMSDAEIFVPVDYYPPGQTMQEYFYGDVGLIKVPELDNRTDIGYPRFPQSREEAEGTRLLVTVGVGVTENGRVAENLEFMTVSRRSRVGETPAFSRDYLIERDHFVAKDSGGQDQDACRGDSGGGIFIPSRNWVNLTQDSELDRAVRFLNNDEDVIVGVVSWGPTECGVPGAYTVYTDVLYWAEWIQETMDRN